MVSRCLYYRMGVRFDAEPLTFYWQLMDPVLLHDALWQSLFYLRTQPPGLDLFIGVIMHLFPGYETAAFQAAYLALGLILTVSLFLLLDRLHVNRGLALLITVICVVSPATELYENLLFYEYPIAVFLPSRDYFSSVTPAAGGGSTAWCFFLPSRSSDCSVPFITWSGSG